MPGKDELDPDVRVELTTMSNETLANLAFDIVFEIAVGLNNPGLAHLKAINEVVEEAFRRRVALGGGHL